MCSEYISWCFFLIKVCSTNFFIIIVKEKKSILGFWALANMSMIIFSYYLLASNKRWITKLNYGQHPHFKQDTVCYLLCNTSRPLL